MKNATDSVAIQAELQNLTEQLEHRDSKRRSDPPQWVIERGGAFPPLEQVTRPNLTTAEAAHFLNRKPQTLRAWACLENGPIRARRIGGLLAWSTADVKTLCGVA